MNRWALAWAVSCLVVACSSSSKVLERSAPERPAWVEQAPAARNQLYFVGTCTDLPSYQEALDCARAEGLLDVTAWVGGRFSSYVYSSNTEEARRGGSSVHFDSDLFLSDVRRSDTYYEIRQENWGRSYLVSVLLTYPRQTAEAERARIEEATARSTQIVSGASLKVERAALDGRWRNAMNSVLVAAAEVAVPENFGRAQHLDQLAGLARDLVAPLLLTAHVDRARVEVQATYLSVPADGLPLECLLWQRRVAVATGSDGRAVCEMGTLPAGESGRLTVRPDISKYLGRLPREASGLARVLGELLDHSVSLEVGTPLHLTVSVTGGSECDPAIELLRERLQRAGAQISIEGLGAVRIEVACTVEPGGKTGVLFAAKARGLLTLDGDTGRVQGRVPPVNGLGATEEAAREEALQRLGDEMSDLALKLLRGYEGAEEN